jgi:hypothetical protein
MVRRRRRHTRTNYVVYEHWRPDLNKCFYIGFGNMHRARCRSKSARKGPYRVVLGLLAEMGLRPIVKIVRTDLSWNEALALETTLIKLYRRKKHPIVNISLGIGGLGMTHGLEARRRMGASRIGRTVSPKTRAKIRAGNLGKKRSEATREKIRIANFNKPAPSEETKARISARIKEWWRLRKGEIT